MHLSIAEKGRRLVPYAHYVWISALAVFFCVLLWMALPDALITPDTWSYMMDGVEFSFLHPKAEYWMRTPLYGLLLRALVLTEHPSFWVVVVQSIGYILTFNVLLWSLFPLVHRRWVATAIASVLLVFEVMCMRTFIHTAYIVPEAFFMQTILSGVLLILGGWARGRARPLVWGYLLLGIAALIKPVGVALVVVWAPFLFLSALCRRGQEMHERRWRILLVSVLLLLGPTLFWSARNFAVYGSFKTTAFLSRTAMASVINLVADQDVLLPDPAQNRLYIAKIREFQRAVGTLPVYYSWSLKDGTRNPFEFLEFRLEPPLNDPMNIRHYYALDKKGMEVTRRIIAQHPLAYARLVAHKYLIFFALFTVPGELGYFYYDDVYKNTFFVPGAHIRWLLFHTDDCSGFRPPSRLARSLVRGLLLPLDVRAFLGKIEAFVMPAFLHLIALFGVFLLVRAKKKPPARHRQCTMLGMYIVMLFLTAAVYYLATASVEVYMERYAAATGIELHLMVLLAFFAVSMLFARGAK